MSNYNKCVLMGRLTSDPELRYTQDGKAVCSFNLAINRRKKNKDAPDVADFPKCIAWESLAEIIGKYVTKGQLLHVDGRIQTRTWTTPDGGKGYATEVIVQNIELMPKNGNNAPTGPQGQQSLPDGDDPAF